MPDDSTRGDGQGNSLELPPETLYGDPVVLPTPGEAHSRCVYRLADALETAVGDRAVISMHSPIRFDESSELRPDIALLSHGRSPSSQNPAEGLLLVVEVSDAPFTLTFDRGPKAAHYSKHRVPECWVVDLLEDQVLVMRDPASSGYRDIRNMRRGSAPLPVFGLEGAAVPVDVVLGPTDD